MATIAFWDTEPAFQGCLRSVGELVLPDKSVLQGFRTGHEAPASLLHLFQGYACHVSGCLGFVFDGTINVHVRLLLYWRANLPQTRSFGQNAWLACEILKKN